MAKSKGGKSKVPRSCARVVILLFLVMFVFFSGVFLAFMVFPNELHENTSGKRAYLEKTKAVSVVGML